MEDSKDKNANIPNEEVSDSPQDAEITSVVQEGEMTGASQCNTAENTADFALRARIDVLAAQKEAEASPKKDKHGKYIALRRTSIGGQAVLEGVMMKGANSVATAVRAQNGEITVESKYVKSVKERNVILRLPFIRGVVNLCTQLFAGTGILMRSAEVYGDFAEPSKFEKWMSDKLKINPMSLLMTFSVILGIAIAVGLFVFLPNFLTGLIFDIPALATAHPALQSLCEGLIMLVIFVAYILLVSIMKDIRRVFMYHGAEHKVISCYEHGLPLTVDNAKLMSRQHSRCGTTFMFFVIAVSILVFALINWLLSDSVLGWLSDSNIVNAFIKLGVKILFLPVVAGVSYELLKLLAKSDCLIVRILRAPGMLLQKLTTKEPTDDMLEVSIAAFKTVLAMDADNTVPETKFDIRVPYGVARKQISAVAKDADDADLDWLFVEVVGKKRSELNALATLTKDEYDNAMAIANKMKNGEPLQYALGNTEFYGIKLSVNPSVLIPRPETEELAELAVKEIKLKSSQVKQGNQVNDDNTVKQSNGVAVLDMCTGSGAIAVAIAKNAECKVAACDISGAALEVAKANALNNGVKIEFYQGDMWEALDGGRYDIITANPPYIPTGDIAALDKKVKQFEPMLALDGDKDGLKFYRVIANGLSEHLADDGVLFAEFGLGQAESIKEIFADYTVQIINDMEGAQRIARISVQ